MLSLEYLLITIIMIGILALGVMSLNRKLGWSSNASLLKLILPLVLWLGLISLVASTGFFENQEFPPRLFLLIAVPFIFTGVFLNKHKNSSWLTTLPIHWPIAYQTFRVFVELVLWHTFIVGLGPESATFEGYNFEIYVGLSAPVIAYLAYKKSIPRLLLQIWNYIGLSTLAIIVVIFITSVYFPEVWDSQTPLVSAEFGNAPYIFLPAFLMPSAVFMHILSLIQLGKKK